MILKTSPAVFAVGNTYQIMAQTEREGKLHRLRPGCFRQ